MQLDQGKMYAAQELLKVRKEYFCLHTVFEMEYIILSLHCKSHSSVCFFFKLNLKCD